MTTNYAEPIIYAELITNSTNKVLTEENKHSSVAHIDIHYSVERDYNDIENIHCTDECCHAKFNDILETTAPELMSYTTYEGGTDLRTIVAEELNNNSDCSRFWVELNQIKITKVELYNY